MVLIRISEQEESNKINQELEDSRDNDEKNQLLLEK